jgi:hypothetical protein
MTDRRLPQELVSLVHHIELSKAGWWAQGIKRLVVAALWLAQGPMSVEGIEQCLSKEFSISADAGRVRPIILGLLGDGTIVDVPGSGIVISEDARRQFDKEIAEGEKVEAKARDRFVELAKQHCSMRDWATLWEEFNDQLLMPVIQEAGARAYQLVSGTPLPIEETSRFSQYMERFEADQREPLRCAIVEFMDPKSDDARSYVLALLQTSFFLRAGNLSEGTIESLTGVGKRPEFAIFVDTNFLFSILGLHDNPSNEAAQSLMRLLRDLGDKVACRLYVFPLTVDEIKAVIDFHKKSFRFVTPSPNLAAAASSAPMSGIGQRYLAACIGAGRAMSAEEYFGPYLSNLVAILRANSVELFNEKISAYHTRQDVVDDILEQQQHQRPKPTRAQKSYEELRHDVALWHFVEDKRRQKAESPIDAKYFVVTVEYYYLGFDAYKCRTLSLSVPICLHPSALIQLLQFWLPRSKDLDVALVGNLRSRFLLRQFDPKAERVTVDILRTLSRFEHIQDIPTEAIRAVLMNEALRQQLVGPNHVQDEIVLVRDALLTQGLVSGDKLRSAEAETDNLRNELKGKDEENGRLREDNLRDERELAEVRETVVRETQQRTEMGQRIERLEQNAAEAAQSKRDRVVIRQFLLGAAGLFGLVVIFGTFVTYLILRQRSDLSMLKWLSVAACIGIAIWIYVTDARGSAIEQVATWGPFRYFHKFKRFLFSVVVVGVLVSILGNAAWDWIKTHHPW